MNHYLYEIKNVINNMIYVGIRTCKCPIENDPYMGSGVRIKYAISKYGIENFEKRVIATYDTRNDLECAEREYVNLKFVLREDTYNIAVGGKGGDMWSGQTSLKIREKHKRACILTNTSEEFRKKVSDGAKRRFSNDEQRAHLSKMAKLQFSDPEKRARYDAGMKNRKFPDSWIENVVAVKQTPEYKQKRSEIATNWPVLECPVCGKMIKSQGNYTQHINKHKRNGEL